MGNFIKLIAVFLLLTGGASISNKSFAKKVHRKVVVVKHKRYKKYPAKGAVVVRVNTGKTLRHKNVVYYKSNGIYYRKQGVGYKVVAAPVGCRIKVLPKNHVRIVIHRKPYFYHYGTYYVVKGREYVVVLPPVGVQVDDLPEGYEILELDGKTYYIVDRVYYKKVFLKNGDVVFEVVKTT
ncbi:DUF6515 family protein [Marinifilum sp. RC60d5]|uniref:DUF6515 family protein n=1 Tax=Marinifilum sp. RC60d5 TaxID=3458414 RepID=UPI004034F999